MSGAWLLIFVFGGMASGLTIAACRVDDDLFMRWFLAGCAALNWWMAYPGIAVIADAFYQAIRT